MTEESYDVITSKLSCRFLLPNQFCLVGSEHRVDATDTVEALWITYRVHQVKASAKVLTDLLDWLLSDVRRKIKPPSNGLIGVEADDDSLRDNHFKVPGLYLTEDEPSKLPWPKSWAEAVTSIKQAARKLRCAGPPPFWWANEM